MMIKKHGFVLSVLTILMVFIITGCGNTSSSDEGNDVSTIDEGVDTPIEITGYTEHSGPDPDFFLKKGDHVAVISPSALPSREQTDATIEGLKEWGYVPVEGKYVCKDDRTLKNCREDLERALKDPEIKAVFCVRGGYASSEVLDTMDLDLIASAEKPIIGYSDITAYHSAWTTEGVPSIHASMSAAFTDLTEECVEAEKSMLKGRIPTYRCEGSEYDKSGTAEGILIGGNQTILMCVLNTDYDCTALKRPYILFLEDVGIDYHNVHYAMTVLKNKGVLENASGIILGEWTEFTPESDEYDGSSRGGEFKSVADMIDRQFLKDLDIPVAYGFPAGHGEKNYPLLLGEPAKLTVDEDSYTLEWK